MLILKWPERTWAVSEWEGWWKPDSWTLSHCPVNTETVQSQKAVPDYFSSDRLLPLGLAGQHWFKAHPVLQTVLKPGLWQCHCLGECRLSDLQFVRLFVSKKREIRFLWDRGLWGGWFSNHWNLNIPCLTSFAVLFMLYCSLSWNKIRGDFFTDLQKQLYDTINWH